MLAWIYCDNNENCRKSLNYQSISSRGECDDASKPCTIPWNNKQLRTHDIAKCEVSLYVFTFTLLGEQQE